MRSDYDLLELVIASIKDAAKECCYYARKEDDELSEEDFKRAFDEGLITLQQAGEIFSEELREWGEIEEMCKNFTDI